MPADDLLRDAQLLCDLSLGSAIEEIGLDDLALAWREAAFDDRAQLCDGFIEHSLLLGIPWWLGLGRRKASEHVRIDRDLPIGVVASWHADISNSTPCLHPSGPRAAWPGLRADEPLTSSRAGVAHRPGRPLLRSAGHSCGGNSSSPGVAQRRRRVGISTLATARCMSARAALVDAVVPATRGRLNDTTSAPMAATVQIVRARD